MLYKDIIIHCPKQTSSGTQQWGSGRDTFLKNDKAAMILEKNAIIMSIFWIVRTVSQRITM